MLTSNALYLSVREVVASALGVRSQRSRQSPRSGGGAALFPVGLRVDSRID
jgi:hypothetical protein